MKKAMSKMQLQIDDIISMQINEALQQLPIKYVLIPTASVKPAGEFPVSDQCGVIGLSSIPIHATLWLSVWSTSDICRRASH
jgi:hypothetical protein